MCRACSDPSGGRRCPETPASREANKAAATRYYQRSKARLKIAQLADDGIPAHDDTTMPPTYHLTRSGGGLRLTDGKEIGNSEIALPDKPSGALWAAPGRVEPDGAVKSAWTDFEASQSGSTKPVSGLHVIRPQPGAVIVSIESPEDAEALMRRYPATDKMGQAAFDWAAMSRDGIDGVYAAPSAVQGNSAHRGTAFGNLYAWDVSSVAWLSNTHLAVDPEPAPCGTYDLAETDDEYENWPQVHDERMGHYDIPARPDTDTAWDRVPKKVRESKAAQHPDGEGAEPGAETVPERDAATGTKGTRRATSPKGKGGAGKVKERSEPLPPESHPLDAGVEAIEFLRSLLGGTRDGKQQRSGARATGKR